MLTAVRRTLIVTNDFPRWAECRRSYTPSAIRQPEGSVVVYASDHAGAAAFDADQPFSVIRHPTGLLLPTPGARRRIVAALVQHRCTAVWFGAAALGLLAPPLAAGRRRTHRGETPTATRSAGSRCRWAARRCARDRVALRRHDLVSTREDASPRLGLTGAPLRRLAGRRPPALPSRGGRQSGHATAWMVCVSRLVPGRARMFSSRRCQDTVPRCFSSGIQWGPGSSGGSNSLRPAKASPIT